MSRPNVRLAHLPTPLEPMDRLADELAGESGSGPRLLVKRDDCTDAERVNVILKVLGQGLAAFSALYDLINWMDN